MFTTTAAMLLVSAAAACGEMSGGNPSRLAVALGASGSFVALAKSGVSTVPTSAITGDVGVSPAAATVITEFSLTADASNVDDIATMERQTEAAASRASPSAAVAAAGES